MTNPVQKFLGSLLTIAAVGGLAPPAKAANYSGTLQHVIVAGTQFVVINTSGSVSGNRPGCHSFGNFSSFAFDVSTAKGRALLSVAQAALLANKTVFAAGSSSCVTVSGYGTIETLSELSIER